MNRLIFLAVVFLLSSCETAKLVGDLNMVSTRNVDTATEYKILSQYTKGKGSTIEESIYAAVKAIPGGEFMKNVQVFTIGSKFQVEGDVWGTGEYKSVRLFLKPGMKVRASPKYSNSVFGTVISTDVKYVYIEYLDSKGVTKNTKADWESVSFAE